MSERTDAYGAALRDFTQSAEALRSMGKKIISVGNELIRAEGVRFSFHDCTVDSGNVHHLDRNAFRMAEGDWPSGPALQTMIIQYRNHCEELKRAWGALHESERAASKPPPDWLLKRG